MDRHCEAWRLAAEPANKANGLAPLQGRRERPPLNSRFGKWPSPIARASRDTGQLLLALKPCQCSQVSTWPPLTERKGTLSSLPSRNVCPTQGVTTSPGLQHTAQERAPSSLRQLFKALLQVRLAVRTPHVECAAALSTSSSQPRQGGCLAPSKPTLISQRGPGERRLPSSLMPEGTQPATEGEMGRPPLPKDSRVCSKRLDPGHCDRYDYVRAASQPWTGGRVEREAREENKG